MNQQARDLLDALGAAEARRGYDPYFHREFWRAVTAAGQREPLEADVRLTLARAGYVRDGTISAVPPNLRAELDVLRDTGAPAHGAGGGAFSSPALYSNSTSPDDSPLLHGRLSQGLGPNVRRAAPQIFTACMAEGSRSMRDWVEVNMGSMKGTESWTEVWDRAAQIDFAVAQCRTDQELMSRLATDDSLEMHLRRLASIKFRIRTGDKTAAAQMLALHAPGSSVDVAPAWLVSDVTQHSKTEHRRDERLASAHKRGGGGHSRGGGGGSGGGGGQNTAHAPDGGKAFGGGKGNSRGSGGFGRGGGGRGRGSGGGGRKGSPPTQG